MAAAKRQQQIREAEERENAERARRAELLDIAEQEISEARRIREAEILDREKKLSELARSEEREKTRRQEEEKDRIYDERLKDIERREREFFERMQLQQQQMQQQMQQQQHMQVSPGLRAPHQSPSVNSSRPGMYDSPIGGQQAYYSQGYSRDIGPYRGELPPRAPEPVKPMTIESHNGISFNFTTNNYQTSNNTQS